MAQEWPSGYRCRSPVIPFAKDAPKKGVSRKTADRPPRKGGEVGVGTNRIRGASQEGVSGAVGSHRLAKVGERGESNDLKECEGGEEEKRNGDFGWKQRAPRRNCGSIPSSPGAAPCSPFARGLLLFKLLRSIKGGIHNSADWDVQPDRPGVRQASAYTNQIRVAIRELNWCNVIYSLHLSQTMCSSSYSIYMFFQAR